MPLCIPQHQLTTPPTRVYIYLPSPFPSFTSIHPSMAPPTPFSLLLFLLFSSSLLPLLACNTCPPPHKTKPILPPLTLPPPPHHKKPPLPPLLPPPSPPKHPKVKPCPPPQRVKPSLPPPAPVKPIPDYPPPAYFPPPRPKEETCPIDALKLGACVDLLGGLIHVGLGDPVVNQCCPILKGLLELEAAVCLCTTLKLKLLNLTIYAPLALELLITCQKNPPPGYTCTL